MQARRVALTSLLLALLPTSAGVCQGTHRPQASSPGTILYSGSGALTITGPTGWVADQEGGRKLGVQCAFHPADSTFDKAESVLYPDIAEKNAGEPTVQRLMAQDLEALHAQYPKGLAVDAGDLPVGHGKTAKVRYFYAEDQGFIDAFAYVDEPQMIAVLVLNSKNKKAFDSAIGLFGQFVASLHYMDVEFGDSLSKSSKGR